MRKSPLKPEIVLYTVVMRHNAGEAEEMIRLALDIGAAGVWWNPMALPAERLRDRLLTPEQIARFKSEMPALAKKYRDRCAPWQREVLDFVDFLEKIGNSRASEGIYHSDIIDTIPCCAGWILTRILSDGSVVPCCRAGGFVLGNINQSSFREVWLSAAYQDFRKKALCLGKRDPYFAGINCPTACDNFWWNKRAHRVLRDPSLFPLARMGLLGRLRFRRAARRARLRGAIRA
jgi:MoaA/NifB/PqqE/SkfB family radical SAM enzyme